MGPHWGTYLQHSDYVDYALNQAYDEAPAGHEYP
jgi:hypothetical protein